MILSYNKDVGRLYVPNSIVRVSNVKHPYLIKTNDQGFRSNYDYTKNKNPRTKRIIFLGDSYTAGENVNNDDRFSNLVENITGFECYNFGVAGTGFDQHLLIYEKFAQSFEHDMLVICPHLSDITRNFMSSRQEKDRSSGERIVVPKPYFLQKKGDLKLYNVPVPKPNKQTKSFITGFKDKQFQVNSWVLRNFNENIPKVIKKFILKIHKRPLYKGYRNENTDEWILMQSLIERLITNSPKIKIILMPLPETRLYLNPNYQVLFQKVSNKYANVTFVDLVKTLSNYTENERNDFRFEYGHYSPNGHSVIAKALVDILTNYNNSLDKKDYYCNNHNSVKSDESLRVLGISAFYHDSAASLICNGEIIAAAQEERFSRIKHDKSFPYSAINYCLEESYLDINDIDAIVFYDNSYLTLERIISSHLAVAPEGLETWNEMVKKWISSNLQIGNIIKNELNYNGTIMQTEHHRSHASSAFFVSPFNEAAILTIDGVGEWATASISYGDKNKIRILKELEYPNSVGLLYSAFTYYTGFKVNSGEYKLMGLAPYGNPNYVDHIKKNVVDIKHDGSVKLNLDYFNFMSSNKSMTNQKFDKLFGGPPRTPESNIRQKDMDIAKSVQIVTEEILLKMAKHARELTGSKFLCMAGGVALNCVGNGRLVREAGFDDIWIQPAAGDAGGSLGAALDVYYSYFNMDRKINVEGRSLQYGSFWGPAYNDDQVNAFLETFGYKYQKLSSKSRSLVIADYLSQGKVIGHFSGKMEFGPRALGARSILGDPRNEKTQSILNKKIKFRESFRPFAPTVLEEDIADYFELDRPSPYMLLVSRVKKDRCIKQELNKNIDIIDLVNLKRSDIPAVTHVDYSARIQSINRRDHEKYHDVIEAFKDKTNVAVIVNTSFNVRGEPIVCTPEDAYKCFMRTDMDILILENYLLKKEDQEEYVDDKDWKKEYKLD